MSHRKVVKIEKNKKDLFNKILVNTITSIRAIGSIAIVPIYLTCGAVTTACVSTAIYFTDFLDGQLARRLHVQTFFGSLLDGLSDKVFSVACMAILTLNNPIFLVPIACEGIILGINFSSIQRGNNAKSSVLGKAKTALLAATIVGSFLLLEPAQLQAILNSLNINNFDSLLSMSKETLTTAATLPLIASEGVVIADYIAKAHKQDKERKLKNEIAQIEATKNELKEKKEKVKKIKKNRQEIMRDLFDTEYYLENKDGGIKKLLYKKVSE